MNERIAEIEKRWAGQLEEYPVGWPSLDLAHEDIRELLSELRRLQGENDELHAGDWKPLAEGHAKRADKAESRIRELLSELRRLQGELEKAKQLFWNDGDARIAEHARALFKFNDANTFSSAQDWADRSAPYMNALRNAIEDAEKTPGTKSRLSRIVEAARATVNEPSEDGDWEAVKASNLNALRTALSETKEEG